MTRNHRYYYRFLQAMVTFSSCISSAGHLIQGCHAAPKTTHVPIASRHSLSKMHITLIGVARGS